MDDVYGDLENYEEFGNIEQIKEENKNQKVQIETLTNALDKLTQDHDKLLQEHRALELNYSSLLKTARAEIERKTLLIRNLNTEKDQLVLKCSGKAKKSYLSQSVHQNQAKKNTPNVVKNKVDDKKEKRQVKTSISSKITAEKPNASANRSGESLQAASSYHNRQEKLNCKSGNGPENADDIQQDIKKELGKLLNNEEPLVNIHESSTSVILKSDITCSDLGETSLSQSKTKSQNENLKEIKATELSESVRQKTPEDKNDDNEKKIGNLNEISDQDPKLNSKKTKTSEPSESVRQKTPEDNNDDSRKKLLIVNEISNRDPRLKIKSELRGSSVESNSNVTTNLKKESESKDSLNSSPNAQSNYNDENHSRRISKETKKIIMNKDTVIKEQCKKEQIPSALLNETPNTNENPSLQASNLEQQNKLCETKRPKINRTIGKSPNHEDMSSQYINKNIAKLHPKREFEKYNKSDTDTKTQYGNAQYSSTNESEPKHKIETNVRKSRRDNYFENRINDNDDHITSSKYRSKSSYREKSRYYEKTDYTEMDRYHDRPSRHNNFKYRSRSRQQYKSEYRAKSRCRDDSRHRDSSDYRENSDHRESSGSREMKGHRDTAAYRDKPSTRENAYRGKRKSREHSWDRSRGRHEYKYYEGNVSRSRKYDNENNDAGESRPSSRNSYSADMKVSGDRRTKATDYLTQKCWQFQSDSDSDKGSAHSSLHKNVRSRSRSLTKSEKRNRSKSSTKYVDRFSNNLKIENTANSNKKPDCPGKLRQRRKSMFERTSEITPVLGTSDEETDVFRFRDRNRDRHEKRSSISDVQKDDCKKKEKHNIVTDLRNVLSAKTKHIKSPPSEPAFETRKEMNDTVNDSELVSVSNDRETQNDTKGRVTPPKQILKSSQDNACYRRQNSIEPDFDGESCSAKHKLCDSSICSTEKRQKLHFEQFEIDNEIIESERSVENKNLFSRDDYRRLDHPPFQSPEDTDQRRECVEVPLIKSCMDDGIRHIDPRLLSSKYVCIKSGDKVISLHTKRGTDIELVRVQFADTMKKTIDNPEINKNTTNASKAVATKDQTVENEIKINEQNLPAIDSDDHSTVSDKLLPKPTSDYNNDHSAMTDKQTKSEQSPKKHNEAPHNKDDSSQLLKDTDTQLQPTYSNASPQCQSRKVQVEIHCQRVSESENCTKPDDNAVPLKTENTKKPETESNQNIAQEDAKEIEFKFLEQKLSALISSPVKGSSLRISNLPTSIASNEIVTSESKADSSLENLVKCLESDDAHPSKILTEDFVNLRSLHSSEPIENATTASEFSQLTNLLTNNSCTESDFLNCNLIKDSSYVPSKPMTTAELLKDFVMSDDACDSAEFCSITGKTSSNPKQEETVIRISDHVTKGTESLTKKHSSSRKRKIAESSSNQPKQADDDSENKPKKKRVQLITLRTGNSKDKINTISHKNKFSELFGDSTSSFITPDDLNISSERVRNDMPDLLVDSRVDFSKAKIASSVDDIIPEKAIVTDNSLTLETKEFLTGLEKISPLPNSSKSDNSLNLSSPTVTKNRRGRPKKNAEPTKVSQTGKRGRKAKEKETGKYVVIETDNTNKKENLIENTNELLESERSYGSKIDITPDIYNSREETRSDTLINAELFKYNQEYSMLTSTPNKRLYEIKKARLLPNAVITNYNVMAADPNVFTIQSGIAPNLVESSEYGKSKTFNTPVPNKHTDTGNSDVNPTKNVDTQNSLDNHGNVNSLENKPDNEKKSSLKDNNGSLSECSTTAVSPPTLSIRISRRRNIIRK